MMGRVRRAGGYTLVEVLVAVVVFGILAASAYVALDALARAAETHRDRSDEFAAVQVAVARLDNDLRQLAARPALAPGGRLEPALVGDERELAGTRAGWANPAGLDRSTLQRFGWRLSGSDLQRIHWPVTDRAPGSRSVTETVLADVTALRFRFRDGTGSWHSGWPLEEAASARLPTAIETVLESRRFGRIRRVVVLQ